LICFTPKKLLRCPTCVSKLKDFTEGRFQEVIDDNATDIKNVKRVAFCTGKVYYDLIERREKEGANDIAFVRIEQLYPFPHKQVDAILKKYNKAKDYLWIQEESENAGAWRHIEHTMKGVNLTYIGRDEMAAPATGFSKRHAAELEDILSKTFSKVLATK